MRLNADQVDLVLSHLRVAKMAAASVRTTVLTRDERISAAYLGLCEAALTWRGGGHFFLFARQKAAWRVRKEVRQEVRWKRAVLRRAPADHLTEGDETLDDRDEARRILALLREMPAHNRRAIELRASGLRWHEIGAAMGISTAAAYGHGTRAISKLRATMTP